MIYLDNAATTLRKPLSVYASLFWNTLFHGGNAGRGGHRESMASVRAIVDTQDSIARLFNIDRAQNIVFTPNATYALNTAILGTAQGGGHIIVTSMDHNSVLRPAHLHGNYTVVWANNKGRVNPKEIENAIQDDTCLIVCTHASNVCGTVEPVGEIGKIAAKHHIPFLLDAAQTAGVMPLDIEKIGADMVAFPGHKGLMGPLGTGGLYIKNPDALRPLVAGGTGSNSESVAQPDFMPDKFHSGTMNAPAIAALGKGVEYILKRGAEDIREHETRLAKALRERLMNMDNVRVYGAENTVATVAFNVEGMDSEEFFERLGSWAAVRCGYHCAPLAHKTLGTDKTGAVRVSFGIYNRLCDAESMADKVYCISRGA